MSDDGPVVRRRVQPARLRFAPLVPVLSCLVFLLLAVVVLQCVGRRSFPGLIENVLARASQRPCPRSVIRIRASQRLCPRSVVFVLRASQRPCPRTGRTALRRTPLAFAVVCNLLQHRVLLPQLFDLSRCVVQFALGLVEARMESIVAVLHPL